MTKPVKARPKVDERFPEPIKTPIGESPSFGYRTVAHLLGFNKNTVQRIFQIKGWQVRKRPVGFRPRIHLPSAAKAPDERWATDLCRVWTARDGWASCYGLPQEFITAYSPEQNGMVERVIRTLKDQ